MSLESECNLQILYETWQKLAYVREMTEWEKDRRPTKKDLRDAIVCAYSMDRDRGVVRVWYVICTEDALDDGIVLDANAYKHLDRYQGRPVIPGTIGCGAESHAYHWSADDFKASERAHRESIANHWAFVGRSEQRVSRELNKLARQIKPPGRIRRYFSRLMA